MMNTKSTPLYRKTATVCARPLTEMDLLLFDGIISTNEGEVPFKVGDYLAQDSLGIWPIPQEKMVQNYERATERDIFGYSIFLSKTLRHARKMPEPFEIRGLTGKTGDYLVWEEGSDLSTGWVVNGTLFEQTYELVPAKD